MAEHDDDHMDLVQDNFSEETIEDGPVDADVSNYDENELTDEGEEEVLPTQENYAGINRYKPSQHHTPNQLPTISEERHDDLRSGNSSRMTNRPPSALPTNQSANSFGNSSQFENGADIIEQYTKQVESNKADKLFPEGIAERQFTSPQCKHNSWEPSVLVYTKQPSPDVQNGSPQSGNRPIFGNLSKQIENSKNLQPVESTSSTSPEHSAPITSPYETSQFLCTKTSTPKRPNTGRIARPNFEMSSIYEASPARDTRSNVFSMRQMPQQTTSDTMSENQTIDMSMVRRVIASSDKDLIEALDMARKRREIPQIPVNFRVNTRPPPPSHAPVAPPSSRYAPPPPTASFRAPSSSRIVSDSRTSLVADMSRLSTAKSTSSRMEQMTSSREDVTRHSISKFRPTSARGYPNNSTQREGIRDGRESVNSMRSVSRASSTMTNGGATSTMSLYHPKPLKITPRRLVFGAVQVNETLTLETEVENQSDRHSQIKCSIDSTTDVFKIVDNKMTMIPPGKSVKVRVSFCPSSIGRYQVHLIVEIDAQNQRRQVPMWGIGGVALIQPIESKEVCRMANASEYTLLTNNSSFISFKLANRDRREGFALISVLDTWLRPIPDVSIVPRRGVVLRRAQEKELRIQMPSEERTSSAMSSCSMASTRRRASASGADYIIQISWGEEIMRQRVKGLEITSGRHELIDGLDFTSFAFSDEHSDSLAQRTSGSAHPSSDDVRVFSATYRTTMIYVFSSHGRAAHFRSAMTTSMGTTSSRADDTTMMESSAFRQQTFVNDATVVPNLTRHKY